MSARERPEKKRGKKENKETKYVKYTNQRTFLLVDNFTPEYS